MARIRSIKPDFWTSEQIMECSPNARLLFIGMWNFADDAGRLACSPKTLKAQIYPGDNINSEDVHRMLTELSANGLILSYLVEGKQYLQITGWHHQKIDKPQKAKHPEPPEHSPNIPGMLATDLRGSEGIGEDTDAAAPPSKVDSEEVAFFRRMKQICGTSGGALGAKLLKAKEGSVALARSAAEQASTKQNPREYIGAIINKREPVDDAAARGRSW